MYPTRKRLKKRTLPKGTGGRTRTRHQVTLSPEDVRKLNARVDAAKALGFESNFSREIGRAVDEAEGNLRTAKHALGNVLSPLRLEVYYLKSQVLSGRRITAEDLKPIEDAVERMVARLEPPGPTPENPTGAN